MQTLLFAGKLFWLENLSILIYWKLFAEKNIKTIILGYKYILENNIKIII